MNMHVLNIELTLLIFSFKIWFQLTITCITSVDTAFIKFPGDKFLHKNFITLLEKILHIVLGAGVKRREEKPFKEV